MGKGRSFWEQIIDQSILGSETVSRQPIVEISGDGRVLIENHQGVCAYGKDRILVNIKFGSVCILGCNLEMMHMTKDQLVIYGRINSVELHRRK